MRRLAGIAVALAAWSPANSTVSPTPAPGETHVQTVLYNPQQVIALKVSAGFVLTVEFSPDERIETMVAGSGAAWSVSTNKNADHMFVKANGTPTVTDLTVITDLRTYNFELQPGFVGDPNSAYMVKIVYPAPPSETAQHQAAGNEISAIYRFSGSKVLRPAEMHDNGQSTTISWGAKKLMAAVYVVDEEGRESLVNGGYRDGVYVVDQIANEFIFRLGDDEARASRHLVKKRHK